MMMHRSLGIVADGCWRGRSAALSSLRAAVNAEYAERLEQADLWTRMRLRWQMSAEIRRRLNVIAPHHACY